VLFTPPPCTPSVHYLLTCPRCSSEWHEAPLPGVYRCPWCAGAKVSVDGAADAVWRRDLGML
jgi:hypothetical protein